MNAQVTIVSIGSVAVVTVLSFILLPASTNLHSNLVYGLLSLVGASVVSAGIGTLRSWLRNYKGH